MENNGKWIRVSHLKIFLIYSFTDEPITLLYSLQCKEKLCMQLSQPILKVYITSNQETDISFSS